MFENPSTIKFVVGFLVLTLPVLLLARRLNRKSEAIRPRRPEADEQRRIRRTPSESQPVRKTISEPTTRNPENLARATLRSIENIIVLTDQVAANDPERGQFRTDVQESIIALVSAVILADGVIHPDECKFIKTLLTNLGTDDECREYVKRHAAQWDVLTAATPAHFQSLADYDRLHQTRLSEAALAEYRTVVQCTAWADGAYASAELRVASPHLERLEAVFRRAVWVVRWDSSTELPQIPLERTYRRDEFDQKEVI